MSEPCDPVDLLRHDVAVACAQNSFDFLQGMVRRGKEEKVFAGLYSRVLAALEIYDLQGGGVRQHLKPAQN